MRILITNCLIGFYSLIGISSATGGSPSTALSGGLPPVSFCGEMMPLTNSRVVSRMMSALMNNAAQNTALYFIRQRSAILFPLIEPLLEQYDIPADFKYLPLVESALLNQAVSPKGAAGYWQLMPATAREMGLHVGPGRDERRNLQKSTVAVCRYLKRLHIRLKSWTLVAAAYNGGMARVRWQMQRQSEDSYYALQLPHETSQYLYRVLAYKELLTKPDFYRPVLSPEVLTYLTCPLPERDCTLDGAGNLTFAGKYVGNPASPQWGPQVDQSVLGILSETQQWLAATVGSARNLRVGWTNEQTEMPVAKLMGLLGLHFRRPRFLLRRTAINRRSVLNWEWI